MDILIVDFLVNQFLSFWFRSIKKIGCSKELLISISNNIRILN